MTDAIENRLPAGGGSMRGRSLALPDLIHQPSPFGGALSTTCIKRHVDRQPRPAQLSRTAAALSPTARHRAPIRGCLGETPHATCGTVLVVCGAPPTPPTTPRRFGLVGRVCGRGRAGGSTAAPWRRRVFGRVAPALRGTVGRTALIRCRIACVLQCRCAGCRARRSAPLLAPLHSAVFDSGRVRPSSSTAIVPTPAPPSCRPHSSSHPHCHHRQQQLRRGNLHSHPPAAAPPCTPPLPPPYDHGT